MTEYTLAAVKAQLRDGKYAWPGGYPKYFIAEDGEALSFEAVRTNWRSVVAAHLFHGHGWRLIGCDINWEDTDLTCAHTGKPIESAYGDD